MYRENAKEGISSQQAWEIKAWLYDPMQDWPHVMASDPVASLMQLLCCFCVQVFVRLTTHLLFCFA